MPTSTFLPEQMNSIDYVPWPPGSAVPDVFNLGLYYLGGSKALQRRPLIDWNVYGPALSGRPLGSGDVLTSAEIILYPTSIVGASGFECRIERNTRADWIEGQANWQNYKTGNAWTTAGGDVDATPAPLLFNGPTVLFADMEIAGALDFVEDAIDNRGGVVRVRFRKSDEAVSTSHYWTADSGATLGPRLRVAYATAEPRAVLRPDRVREAGLRGLGVTPPAAPARAARPARPDTV